MNTEDLVKVVVDLPNHWAKSGESMWAKALGNELYELHNSPFYAYDLNYLDVVYAVAPSPDQKPLVLRVARRSGNRTLRALFADHTVKPERLLLSKSLDRYGVTWEGADYKLFSLNIPEGGDYQATCDRLWEWEQSGLLEYETCEARMDGSFDDKPSES
jgi:hypothetical protein